jgi:hypothetical protein
LACRRFAAEALADGLGGATWIDADLVPHQVAAVRQVLASPTVGHLLADEVGLGKTIEALLIWSALLAADPTLRTLVVAPRSLVPQWAFEIQRRATRGLGSWYSGLPRIFVATEEADADFGAFDAPEPTRPVVAEHAALEGSWIPAGATDLLIVDEAHTLTRSQRQGVERLQATAAHTLLLTATPRRSRRLFGAAAQRASGDAAGFSWAVSVIDPRFSGSGEAAERAIQAAGVLNPTALRALQGDLLALARLTEAVNVERTSLGLTGLGGQEPAEAVVMAAAAEIGPYARVVRTQRRCVTAGLGRRELRTWNIDYRREELELLKRLSEWFTEAVETGEVAASGAKRMAASSWAALRGIAPPELQGALRDLDGGDAREEALLDLLSDIWSKDPAKRVVIRAEYADTRSRLKVRLSDLLQDGALRETSEALLERWSDGEIGAVALVQRSQESLVDGIARIAHLQEGGEDLDVAETILGNLVAFDEGDACVLVGDSTAEVGLNLQHASDLIFMDLPWSPRLAEQWIGRLDRLGRRDGAPVRIHILTHPEATDVGLFELYEALGVFGRGYQVPPEIAEEVDALIAKADRNQLDWRDAIRQAKRLVEDIGAEDGDTLLESLAPNQRRAEAVGVEALGVGLRAEEATTREFFDSLKKVGFQVKPAAHGRVAVEWGHPVLALRDLRGWMGPRELPKNAKPGHIAGKGRMLDVPLERQVLGEDAGRGDRMVFSPRHPLFKEVAEELALEVGGAVTFLAAPRPAFLAERDLTYAALVQTRTFPEAQGERALWNIHSEEGGPAALGQLRAQLSGAIGRILTQTAPPGVGRRGFLLRCEAETARVGRVLEGEALEALWAAIPAARDGVVRPWLASGVEAIEVAVATGEDDAPPAGAPEALRTVRAFLAQRRVAVLAAADKAIEDKQTVVRTTGGNNPGFQMQLELAKRARQVAETFLNGLESALANDTAVIRGARSPVVTEVVFLKLEDGA